MSLSQAGNTPACSYVRLKKFKACRRLRRHLKKANLTPKEKGLKKEAGWCANTIRPGQSPRQYHRGETVKVCAPRNGGIPRGKLI